LTGAVAGALVSGIFDHYWFNMTYPHMTVLLWLYIGLGVTTMLIHGGAEHDGVNGSVNHS
jgi:polysaccharide biosynthesis protein PslJ